MMQDKYFYFTSQAQADSVMPMTSYINMIDHGGMFGLDSDGKYRRYVRLQDGESVQPAHTAYLGDPPLIQDIVWQAIDRGSML